MMITKGKRKPGNCIFSLKCCLLFCQQAYKTHLRYHMVTGSQLKLTTFTVKMIDCIAVSKWELFSLFFVKRGVKVNRQYCSDIFLSQQLLDAIKSHWWQFCWFFQQGSALAHLAFNTVLQHFLSPELRPHNSAELNSTDYEIYGVIQQHDYELWVTRLNKLSQLLAEVWQCNSNTAL